MGLRMGFELVGKDGKGRVLGDWGGLVGVLQWFWGGCREPHTPVGLQLQAPVGLKREWGSMRGSLEKGRWWRGRVELKKKDVRC